jgi:hypothetical protein
LAKGLQQVLIGGQRAGWGGPELEEAAAEIPGLHPEHVGRHAVPLAIHAMADGAMDLVHLPTPVQEILGGLSAFRRCGRSLTGFHTMPEDEEEQTYDDGSHVFAS